MKWRSVYIFSKGKRYILLLRWKVDVTTVTSVASCWGARYQSLSYICWNHGQQRTVSQPLDLRSANNVSFFLGNCRRNFFLKPFLGYEKFCRNKHRFGKKFFSFKEWGKISRKSESDLQTPKKNYDYLWSLTIFIFKNK